MARIKFLVLSAIALAPALALPGSKTSATCAQPTVPSYQACGGFAVDAKPCPKGHICIDDPRKPSCGMACGIPGICVEPIPCMGFVGKPCEDENKICVDDPTDTCDPNNGGRDCLGLCV
ncbi:hypothetical protein MAPG_06195 [Magnaporthiopsis poae ATCC 64411]|uniref:Uncharacterized protein n=1 Tax=Magnaporthiopsis poae (strain ATCC 64411 / 73-15) TaxID=644358 RepID=A0A0C4E1D6_MAGP6|nr:hypothetical protein MAPG_06195 [Magnaporthiopsis poae ATCC 64411]